MMYGPALKYQVTAAKSIYDSVYFLIGNWGDPEGCSAYYEGFKKA